MHEAMKQSLSRKEIFYLQVVFGIFASNDNGHTIDMISYIIQG